MAINDPIPEAGCGASGVVVGSHMPPEVGSLSRPVWPEVTLWIWWSVFSALAFVSLFAFPLYKRMPIGLLSVLLGIAVAPMLKILPSRHTRSLSSMIYIGWRRSWLIAVCALAIVLRLPVVLHPPVPHTDHRTYYTLAIRLASGLGYGRSLLYPPGQPAWLAVWVYLFGHDLRLLAAVQAGLLVVSIPLLHYALKPWAEKAARWGCLLIACFPSLVLYSGTLGHETTAIFLSVLLLSVFLSAFHRTRWRGVGAWVAVGCTTGLTAFVRPTFLVFPIVLALILWIRKRNLLGVTWRVSAAGVAMALVIAPWAVRNYRMFGKVCLISANLGSVLLSSNHPDSDGLYWEGKLGASFQDSIDRDHFELQMALGAIWNDPVKFLARVVKRHAFLWGTDTSVLDFVLGDNPPEGITRRRAVLSLLMQTLWAWFVCAWLIATIRAKPWRYRHPAFETYSVAWVAAIWTLHLFVEPHSRHHLALVPFMGVVFLPVYWDWVVGKAHESAVGAAQAPPAA